MFRTFIFPSSGVLIYRLFHCHMWCYAIRVEAVVLRSWCVVLCTVCQLISNLQASCQTKRDKFVLQIGYWGMGLMTTALLIMLIAIIH